MSFEISIGNTTCYLRPFHSIHLPAFLSSAEERLVSTAASRGMNSPVKPSSFNSFFSCLSLSRSWEGEREEDQRISSIPRRRIQSSLTSIPSITSMVLGRCLMKNGAGREFEILRLNIDHVHEIVGTSGFD